MADAISLLNGAIIPDLLYGDRFPEINKDNLSSIMLSQPPNVISDFVGIMGKLVKQNIEDVVYTRSNNPFSFMVGEKLNFGETIEDIFVNIIEGSAIEWDASPESVLKLYKTDIRSLYHSWNYEMQYSTSISMAYAQRAFLSEGGIRNLMNVIASKPLHSADYDLFLHILQTLKQMNDDSYFYNVGVQALNTETALKNFILAVKDKISELKFMNNIYNKAGVITRSEDLMLVINPKTLNNIDVNLLSGIFNTAKMELDCEIIKVPYLDSGIDGKEVIGYLMDKKAIKFIPTLEVSTEQFNAKGLHTNLFYTCAGITCVSTFSNAVKFTVDEIPSIEP